MAEERKNGELNFKVSEKGGVSVYGLGRFPVTLYYEQWTRLLASTESLNDFIDRHLNGLSVMRLLSDLVDLRLCNGGGRAIRNLELASEWVLVAKPRKGRVHVRMLFTVSSKA